MKNTLPKVLALLLGVAEAYDGGCKTVIPNTSQC
jgi:hypothetical protein